MSTLDTQSSNVRSSLPYVLVAALVLAGCGGGGGGSHGSSAGKHPSAKTVSDVANNMAAISQSAASNSFRGFGPKLLSHGQAFFDSVLQLYGSVVIAPAAINESLWTDQARSTSAGSLTYHLDENTATLSGPFTVTSGPYNGVSGTYNQVTQTNSNKQAIGYNGSIVYSMPGVANTDNQYSILFGDSGHFSGTGSTAVALENGYSQTEKITYNSDFGWNATSTDSASLKCDLVFESDNSGSGKITGSDPGLPATLTWDVSGNGQIRYADGTTASL
ncbi:MAG TPA: hypothetical protein VG944_20410, partial [Fimbriimonas sp.]|nr:hypothetical protein [Fimbriimonas sp.]